MSGSRSSHRQDFPCGALMLQRHVDLEPLVESVLERRPGTRGDWLQCWAFVCRDYYGVSVFRGVSINDLLFVPSPENVARQARVLIYGDKKRPAKRPDLQPSERVQEKRQRLFEAMKNHYGGGSRLPDWYDGN